MARGQASMASDRDHYVTLGIGEDATPAQVRSAYRRAARANHPDLHPDDDEAAGRFMHVQEAYEVLSDPTRRAAYRRPMAPGAPSAPPASSYVQAWAAAGTGGAGRPVGAARPLTPELIEALLVLRALARQARLERRFRRLLRMLEDW